MGKYEEFARWFRIELAKKGWKGSDLVRELEILGQPVASATISKWRKGQVQASRENCAVLAEVFDVPVADVLMLAGHEPLEQSGPLLDLSRRLARLPLAVRESATQQIVEYGNQILDDLENADAKE